MSLSESSPEDEFFWALRDLPLVKLVPESLRPLIISSFERVSYKFGDEIIREGDTGDAMYVILRGSARVVKVAPDGTQIPLDKLTVGDSFGMFALLSDSPRTATVRASEDLEVSRLDRSVFRGVLRAVPEVRKQIELFANRYYLRTFLRTHSAFSQLSNEAMVELLLALEPVDVKAGELVIREGDPPGPMYIVKEGHLIVLQGNPEERAIINYLRTGDFLGEMSLFAKVNRTASVEAVTDCELLALDPAHFQSLLDHHPDFHSYIDERVKQYNYRIAAHVPIDFTDEILPAQAQHTASNLTELDNLDHAHFESDSVTGEEFGYTGAQHSPEELGQSDEPEPISEDEYDPERERDYEFATKRTIRRFHHMWQIDEMDCGATCLAMICRHYGNALDRTRLRAVVGTDADGASLFGLVSGAQKIGFKARGLKVSKDRLDQLPLPAIAHWDYYHWVVVYRVSNGLVLIDDPALGKRRIKRDEFLKRWSGFAALLAPTPELDLQPRATKNRWLLNILRSEHRVLWPAAALALVASALQMLLPVSSSFIVDDVFPSTAHRSGQVTQLYWIIPAIFAVLLVATIATIIQRYLLSRGAVRINRHSLEFLTTKLLALPFTYFSTRRTGDVGRRLANLQQLRQVALTEGVAAITAGWQLLIAVGLMFYYNALLALAFIAAVPLYATLVRFSTTRLRPAFANLEEAWARYQGRQVDAVKGIDTVKAMGAERGLRRFMLREYERLSEGMFRTDLRMMLYGGAIQIVTFVSFGLFLWIGTLLVIHGKLSVGGFVAFNALVLLANGPIQLLMQSWDSAQYMNVILTRMNDIVESEPEQGLDRSHLLSVRSLGGEVELVNLGFSYPGPRPMPVLHNINLKVRSGQTIAIVGRSGSGKTTLVKCLTGMLEPTTGKILLDGVDLTTLDYIQLRRLTGVVLQDSWLFEESIARNIAFGDDEVDMRRVIWAAKMADAHDFVSSLPLGYETRVGETGMKISGGQRQRITIARALYRDPPILILDEATSALDTESERAVQQNLGDILTGRTTFVIAHRLSTVHNADLIIVLEKGHLVESGTHDELMARQGLYYYLSSQQLDL